jgi:hypothetical protein
VAKRLLVLSVALVAVLGMGVPSSADHGTRPIVGPLQPMGDSPNVVTSDLSSTGRVNTDLAFWGNRVFQGLWNGFRVIDVTNPAAPTEVIKYEDCGFGGNQGDIVVWENLLIRAWNTGQTFATTCDGQPVPVGFEGIHIFDISNINNPQLVGSVETVNGTHTLTLVPDLANGRLIVYSNASQGVGLDVITVPLANPSGAAFVRLEQAIGTCHDVQVFMPPVGRVVCAGGSGITVWSLNAEDGGTLLNPAELYSQPGQGVGIAHSAAFSWDGKMFAIGHEPGGGTDDRCDAEDRELERTLFLYETDTGDRIGRWVMNPPQSELENCTVHNYNFIPTLSGRDIMVGGHYQAGTWVVDLTDPKNPFVIARADPPPLNPSAFSVGGAWSSYWYNGYIYESEITKGLHIFDLNVPDAEPGRFRPEAFSNPQTQMEPVRLGKCKGQDATLAGTRGQNVLEGTSVNDIIVGLGGNDRINGRGGNDIVCGGSGGDKLRGSLGDDVLQGQGGADSLHGGPGLPDRRGDDVCNGGGGRDRASRSCETKRKI